MPSEPKKGILGVKKDPKNQVLFSFDARKGDEWPSDDSDDSDYAPNDDCHETSGYCTQVSELKCIIRRGTEERTTTKRESVSTKKHKRLKLAESEPGQTSHSNHGDGETCQLPQEVLQMIFQYVVSGSQGALPFLCRAARVCRMWREAAQSPSLWTKVDLSYGWIKSNSRTLSWLCENRFTQLREVNLSSWKKLTNSDLESLVIACPDLQCVNLSFCKKIKGEGMSFLVDRCSGLQGLDLSYMGPDAVNPAVLKQLLSRHSSHLVSLNLSGNMLRGFQQIFKSLCDCPKLEELQLNQATFSNDVLSINIELFQKGCPKLRVLQMSLTSYRATATSLLEQASSLGFPELEEVTLATDTNILLDLNDTFIHRLLKSSLKLKSLDLRRVSKVKCQTLQSLPATDLERLYIAQSSLAKCSGIEIIMSKWQHSLRDLDMSWNFYPGVSLDSAMEKLADNPKTSVLKTLNLSGTSITCDRVSSLLTGCPKLHTLNLCSCRSLPRGMKRDYNHKALRRLRGDIDDILKEEAA